LDLFDINEFKISVPKCPTRYSPTGNNDILDIVVRQSIRLSGVIVSDILDPDHIPIAFHILDHVKTTNLLEPISKFTYWERFQSLASDLISPLIKINSEEEANDVVHNFIASAALAYKLSSNKVTFSDINKQDLPGLDPLLKHKWRRKLWQETQDPA
jgi:hypothetical protein